MQLIASVFAIVFFILLSVLGEVSVPGRFFSWGEIPEPLAAEAADGQGYGEKKEVKTMDDAQRALREYYAGKDVKIGEVKEKELYFEAEIRDRSNKLIDKVIIDKRTGRIRSIL